MNNGRPPYGDSSQWGQQPAAGQDPAAQFVPGQSHPMGNQNSYQQPGYGQQYAQSQPYQTYQPQVHQAQEGYPQQTWQPYQQPYAPQGSQQAYQQQGGYPQQQYAQQGGYPQQQYAQQGGYPQQQYAQQGGYPQQQYAQQGYAQQADPQMYQQGAYNGQPVQNGQQFYPAQGFSGYVTGNEGGEQGGTPITPEVIAKVAIFGVLPVFFVLGQALQNQPLCWIFLALYALTAAALWMWDLVSERMRLLTTLIGGVAAIVALVVAINGSPAKEIGQTGGVGGHNASGSNNTQQTAAMTWEATPTPSPSPTPTPDPHAEAGVAAERLQSFFYFWHVNNDENMLLLTAPSWRNAQEDPLKALFTIRANRTPQDNAEIVSISGSEADTVRTAKVKVTITKNISGRSPEILSFNVLMVKENDEWYVDPRSLTSNEVISTTKTTNEMYTQPVLHTGTAETILYYNPDGGEMYHIDPYCGKINSRYLPLQGQFLFSQLDESFYRELENCTYCGAPLRNK